MSSGNNIVFKFEKNNNNKWINYAKNILTCYISDELRNAIFHFISGLNATSKHTYVVYGSWNGQVVIAMGVYYDPSFVGSNGSKFQCHFGIHRNPLVKCRHKQLSLPLHLFAYNNIGSSKYIVTAPLSKMRKVLIDNLTTVPIINTIDDKYRIIIEEEEWTRDCSEIPNCIYCSYAFVK